MKISKVNVFLLLVLFASCGEKNTCVYTEDEHRAKLNSKISHSIYKGDGEESKNWTVYDETDSFGRGNCYIFNKGKLEVFTFHYSKENPCYMERSNGNGGFNRITTQPLLDFYFCENSESKIHLYLNFTLIKNVLKQVKISNKEGKSNILHIEKDSSKTNEYYCKVFLSKQDSNSIKKAKYYLEYKSEDCRGNLYTFYDTAKIIEQQK